VLFALTLWAGFTGSTHAEDNLAPTMVFAGFWVAVPVLSLVVGDVWRTLSPWRTLALLGEAVRRRRAGAADDDGGAARGTAGAADGDPGAGALTPQAERIASVVAVLALVGFGWLELAAPDRDDPFVLASVAAGYAALMLLGAALLGRPFLDRADGFGRLFSLLAALAPLAWRGGALRLRPPAVGIAEVAPRRTVAAVVVVAIGIATFDGLSATAVWARGDAVGARLEDAMGSAGLSPVWSTAGAATVGLLGSIALVAVIVRLGTGRLPASDTGRGGRLGAFAPTLVPIAVAYLIAHYAGLLLVQGQVLVVRLSDPRGDGANLFGTAGWGVDLQPLSPEALWYVQIGALVLGHVAALAAAHDLALRSFPDRAAAARSQLPMLAAMVALTALGLRLVAGSTLR
jgi:hypothetical protein